MVTEDSVRLAFSHTDHGDGALPLVNVQIAEDSLWAEWREENAARGLQPLVVGSFLMINQPRASSSVTNHWPGYSLMAHFRAEVFR